MKLKVFSVHDVKAGAFLPPFFLPRTEMAIRVFADSSNDSTHMFCKHPDDFCLFELGEWDGESALFDLLKAPKSLGLALSHRKVKEDYISPDEVEESDLPESLKVQAS